MALTRFLAVWLLFTLAACQAPRAEGPNATPAVDEELASLLACNDRAIGGEALRAIQAVEFDLEIVEPGFSLTGLYRADRAGVVRIDVFAGTERVFSEGWEHGAGWQLPQGASVPVPIDESAAAPLWHGLEQPGHLWTLQDMTRNGHVVELVDDPESVSSETALVKVTLRDGFEVWYRLDRSSCRILANRDFRAFHPDIDPEQRWIETRFEGFQAEDGVTRARTSFNVDLASGDTIGRTRLLAVRAILSR
ncbi:MAG: hypothetical protein O2958_02755 [Gemmatimonadetes bacterium]|nr:hypothetical protein [Gemmatimonadota bacterium]MDA1101973.1 hypothetical protein [Gemmatimonadota bacterium]